MVASRDTLRGAAADVAMREAIPLDLAALLTPYRQHRRLSLRVVQLPPRAALSAGVRNDDASWSLTPGDLDGLALELPDDVEPPASVAVRIVVIDKNETASVVGQFEVPLPRAARARAAAAMASSPDAAAWQCRLDRRAAAAKRLAARTAARAVAAAETRWRAEADARLAERIKQSERDARTQLEAAALRSAEAEAEVRRLQTKLAEAAAQWQAEAEARHAGEAQAAELAWRQKLDAERAARKAAEDSAAAAAQRAEALAAELAAAREATRHDVPANYQDADHQRSLREQVQEVEARLAAEAKERLLAARGAWRKESETQTAAAVQEAVRKAEAVAAARLREVRAEWEREAQEALAAAEGQWRIEAARRLSAAQAEWQKAAQAKATAGRRKLRGVARRQGMSQGLRRASRLALVAGCLAAGFALAAYFKPTIVDQWMPTIIALASDVKTAVVSELPWPKDKP